MVPLLLCGLVLAFTGAPVVVALKDPQPATGTMNPVPWFDVDLDAAPEDRWTHIVQQYKAQTLLVLDEIENRIPKDLEPLLTKVLDEAEHFWPLDLRQEMQGVADALGVDVGWVLATSLFYELNSGCTSAVAQVSNASSPDGTMIFHGRNLDYTVPGLQNVTINVRFKRQGEVLYTGTTYVAYLGAYERRAASCGCGACVRSMCSCS
jgi:hypothetical protein